MEHIIQTLPKQVFDDRLLNTVWLVKKQNIPVLYSLWVNQTQHWIHDLTFESSMLSIIPVSWFVQIVYL